MEKNPGAQGCLRDRPTVHRVDYMAYHGTELRHTWPLASNLTALHVPAEFVTVFFPTMVS
jgi:hypothetical protein